MLVASSVLLPLLLGSGVASAHLPHQQVFAVAVPSDLDETVPWYLSVSPSGSDILLRSDDGGWMWQIVGGDPTMDALRHGAYLPDGTVVLSGAEGLWVSTDGGASWSYEALPDPATDLAVLGDRFYVGTDAGLVSGTSPDALDTVELDGVGIQSLHVDQDTLIIVSREGDLQRRSVADTAWTRLPTPGEGATAAAWDASSRTLYAADGDGLVYRFEDGTWTDCGLLPTMEHPGIYEMAVASGLLIVAPGEEAAYVSEDRCESFEDRIGMVALYEVEGGVAAPPEAFTAIGARGAEWYVSGWDGWIRSDDAGASWAAGFLIPVDYTRGLNFSPDFENDGRVFIGGYAAGVIVGIEGGADYFATGYGLYRYNSQKAYAAPDDADTVYAIIGHGPWRSDDGGNTWVKINEGYVPTLDFTVVSADEIWIMGTGISGTPADLAHSTDRGATWEYVESLNGPVGDSIASHMLIADGADGVERYFVLAQKPAKVVRSEDGGASWEAVYTAVVDTDEISEGAAWPPEDATHLVVGVGGAILRSGDWGETWDTVEVVAPNAVMALAMGDDGTMLVGLKNGALLRSQDGGVSWEELDLMLPSAARAISMRPNFAEHPVALIGTHDGIFAIEELHGDAPTKRRWGAWQVVDQASQPMICETCPGGVSVSEDFPGAGRDQVLRIEPEMVLRTVVRGHTVRVLGAIDGGGNVTVEVGSPRLPGDAVNISGGKKTGIVELARFELDDDWHEVEIRGVTGNGILIDAVEGISDQPPLEYAGSSGDGGASDGGADGGSADGGSTDGGSTDGGSADGGSADGGSEADGGSDADDTGDTGKDDTCGGCSAAPAAPLGVLLPLLLALVRRRR